jgi:phosphoglycerate dehydrogenase-like enzyme
VSAVGPVVVLADVFGAHLQEALASALPPDSSIVHGLEDQRYLEAQYVVTWAVDINAETQSKIGDLRGVIKLDSGPGQVFDPGESSGLFVGMASSPALVSVAEHTVMLILAVFKRLGRALEGTRSRQWAEGISPILTNQEEYSYNWVGLEKFEAVTGKTVGLVGLGRIGIEVARRLVAFGCDVVYTKRHRLGEDEELELGVRYLPLADLLEQSHCVSLHNRFDAQTERMMGAEQFRSMPRGSFLVNTARGRLVDEDALVDALRTGHLAGAALDVAWYEPPLPNSPLWNAPNLLLTPHSAGIPIDVSLVEELTKAGEIISTHWAGQKAS